jgi:hypothetical protein
MKREETRIRVFCLTAEMVLETLKPNGERSFAARLSEAELPRDAQFRGLGHDFGSNAIVAFFEHPSFEPVPPNLCAPRIPVRTVPVTHSLAILDGHRTDIESVRGRISFTDRGPVAAFSEETAPTREGFFAIFGNCGYQVVRQLADGRILEARILEWSTPEGGQS